MHTGTLFQLKSQSHGPVSLWATWAPGCPWGGGTRSSPAAPGLRGQLCSGICPSVAVVPDVGCFRANALMASNQAVDSTEVMAFPRRGRWLWLVPGALPSHYPCQVPAGCALLTLKKCPATPSEMGIDTGLLVHGCGWTPALGKAVLWPGLTAWVLGRERAGTWGHHGDQHWHHPVRVTQGAALTAGYSHHRASHPFDPMGAWTAQHSPCVTHGGHTRTRCTPQRQDMTRGHDGARGHAAGAGGCRGAGG